MVRKHKNGFTLVELLSVIVILSVILIIAVPQIMKTTNQSREAVFSATVKLIATSAEKRLLENETLEIEDKIRCEEVVELNDEDYEDCTITFDEKIAYVTLIGRGKFKNVAVVDGTKTNVELTTSELAKFVPSNAVKVKTESELVSAIENATEDNPNILINSSISLSNSIAINNKKVSIYSRNSKNVISTAKTSIPIFTVGTGATLETYGVTINQSGGWNLDDNGNLVIKKVDTRQTAPIFKVTAGGKLLLSKGTKINNVSSTKEIVYVQGSTSNRATAILENVKITNCTVTTGIVNATSYADIYLNEGTEISNNISYNNANHGIIRIYTGSVVNVNGAKIINNRYSGNGMIGLYSGAIVINSGSINDNAAINRELANIDGTSSSNGRYGLIYVHSASNFTMNGGEIKNNKLLSQAAIDSPKTNSKVTLVGGLITNNIVTKNGETFDFPVTTYYSNSDRFECSNDVNITGRIYDNETTSYININEQN